MLLVTFLLLHLPVAAMERQQRNKKSGKFCKAKSYKRYGKVVEAMQRRRSQPQHIIDALDQNCEQTISAVNPNCEQYSDDVNQNDEQIIGIVDVTCVNQPFTTCYMFGLIFQYLY